jgi:hypothetical protein
MDFDKLISDSQATEKSVFLEMLKVFAVKNPDFINGMMDASQFQKLNSFFNPLCLRFSHPWLSYLIQNRIKKTKQYFKEGTYS